MFGNIGAKIKVLAKVQFALVAIVAFFTGMEVCLYDEIIGILVMIGGPIVAWFSSWLLYGFGELIDKACEIAENMKVSAAPVRHIPAPWPTNPMKADAANETPDIQSDPSKDDSDTGEKVCPKCGTVQKANRTVCWSCNQPFSN